MVLKEEMPLKNPTLFLTTSHRAGQRLLGLRSQSLQPRCRGADGCIAVHSRETVDSSDSDDEEPVNDASNNNGIAVEDRVDHEQAADARSQNLH